MAHAVKWVECTLPNQKHGKKNVNFFYIHESSRTCPITGNETQIWQQRYNLCVGKYPPIDSARIGGKKNHPSPENTNSEPPRKKPFLMSSLEDATAFLGSLSNTKAAGCSAYIDGNVSTLEHDNAHLIVDLTSPDVVNVPIAHHPQTFEEAKAMVIQTSLSPHTNHHDCNQS